MVSAYRLSFVIIIDSLKAVVRIVCQVMADETSVAQVDVEVALTKRSRERLPPTKSRRYQEVSGSTTSLRTREKNKPDVQHTE